jgi:hypothetical protein
VSLEETVELSDLERLVELVRAVADDPTTTYKTRRQRSADHANAQYVQRRRARKAAQVVQSDLCLGNASDAD